MQSEAVYTSQTNSPYRVFGKHVYGDVIVKNLGILRDEDAIREIVVRAARVGGMTLMDIKSWRIGDGVSVMALVLESHITVHTWPEHYYATIDVYSCGEHTDPEQAFQYIANKMDAVEVRRGVVNRSLV